MQRAYSVDWSPNALSPTTAKLVVQKNEKKIEKLKEELQIELCEKNELIDENGDLKREIDSLKKQLNIKNGEIERLKEDAEILQHEFDVAQKTSSDSNKISKESAHLKQDLSTLKAEKELLENEVQGIRIALEKADEKIKFLASELTTVEREKQEFEAILYNKEMEINQWKRKYDENRIEISDLNEYNRTLNERVNQLESNGGANTFLPLAESLDREFQFQSMQERIDGMTTNMRVIEEEQKRLMNENEKLSKDKHSLELTVKKVKQEASECQKRSDEATEKLNILLEENLKLNEENRNLKSKIRNAEKIMDSCRQKFEFTIREYNESRRKLLAEKHDLDTNLLTLSQELHSTTRQLEDAIAENKAYETILQETKTALQDKITALLVMTSHGNEVEKARDSLEKTLRETEHELRMVEATKNELQKELLSTHELIAENSRSYALFKQKIERLESVNEKYSTENKQLQASVSELSEMNKCQSRLLDDFHNRVSYLETEKEEIETSLKHRISLLEERENALRESNQSAIEDSRNHRLKAEEWIRKHAEEVEKRSKIENELREIIEEKNDLSKELEDQAGRLRAMSSERENWAALKENVEQELHKTEKENKTLRAQVLECIREYGVKCGEVASTDEELEKWIVEDRNLYNLLGDILDKLKSVTAESENWKASNESISQKLREVEADNERLVVEVQQLHSQYNDKVEETTRITNELQKMVTDNEHLRIRIEDLTQKLRMTTAESEDWRRVSEIAEQHLLEAKANNENLHTELREWIRKHDVTLEEKTRLNDEIQNLVNEKESLSAVSANLLTEKETLEEVLRAAQTRNEDFIFEVEEWKRLYYIEVDKTTKNDSEIQKLIEENSKLSSQLNAISEKLMSADSTSKELSSLVEKLEQSIREVEANNENLRVELTELARKRDVEAAEKADMSERLQKFVVENGDLSRQLTDLSEKLNVKTRELEETKTLLEQIERRLRETEVCMQSSRQENANLVELRATLLAQLDQLQRERDELKFGNERLIECNKEKLQQLKGIEKRVLSVTEEMDHLRRLNEELGDTNRELTERLDKYQEDEIETKKVNARLSKHVDTLEGEKKHLSSRLEELTRENESFGSQVDSLERKLAELSIENESLTSRIDAVKQELASKESDSEELRRLLALGSHDIAALKEHETELSKGIENLRDQNQKLRQEVDKLMETVELFNAKEVDFRLMREAFDEKLSEKTAELESVRSLLAEKEKNLNALLELDDVTKKELEAENAKIRERVDELLREKGELFEMEKLNSEAFQSQLDSISSKNAMLQTEIEELRESLTMREHDNNFLKEKLDGVEKKLQNEQIRAEGLEKMVAQAEKERTKLNDHIKDKEEREQQLLTQLEMLNIKLVEESERVNILQRTHSSQLRKQVEINKSLESKLQHYESNEKDAYSKRISELKGKLEEALEANERQTEEMKVRLHDNENLIKENENLLIKVDDLETMKTDLQNACERLRTEKNDLRKEHEALSLRVDNMNDMLMSKENDIDRLKDEYEIFKEEYRKLVQHKDELENEFKDTLMQENKKLNEKCDELSTSNSKLEQVLQEKDTAIEKLTMKIEDMEAKLQDSLTKESKLNETHVVSSGTENEIYMNLRQANLKLVEERDNLKRKQLQLEAELEKQKEHFRIKGHALYDKLGKKVQAEFEGKLQRAKAEQHRILTEQFQAIEKEWKKKEEEYKMMINKEREHNKDLNSQNWNLMDQCLQLKQGYDSRRCSDVFRDNFLSPNTLRKSKSATQLHLLGSRGNLAVEPDRRASSISSRGTLVSESDRRLSAMSTISEDFLLPPKKKPSTISGKRFSLSSAKVFPTEDEDQEIFDNACLADLKQGRMPDDESLEFSKQRLSILQARNSLCPPHLKSSYPAETQFIPPQEFKENEIKMGNALEDNVSDVENPLLCDRQRKSRNQTSYKKPGPPTPSKHGGRSTTQVETPKKILRDSNDNGTTRRRSFTPKFFNNLFALRGHVTIPSSTQHNDENIPLTPKHTRLSSIRRRFSRNPQELGHSNSSYC